MTKNNKGRNGSDRATPKTADTHNCTGGDPLAGWFNVNKPSRNRQHQPMLSFVLTADHAIPEAAARVLDLRGKSFNIITRIVPEVSFCGCIRKNDALYPLGSPSWSAPGFMAGQEGGGK